METQISSEAKAFIQEWGLEAEDFTPEELAEVEAQIEADKRGELYMDGVQYRLFPLVTRRKLMEGE